MSKQKKCTNKFEERPTKVRQYQKAISRVSLVTTTRQKKVQPIFVRDAFSFSYLYSKSPRALAKGDLSCNLKNY
jgi:hypothetical protein